MRLVGLVLVSALWVLVASSRLRWHVCLVWFGLVSCSSVPLVFSCFSLFGCRKPVQTTPKTQFLVSISFLPLSWRPTIYIIPRTRKREAQMLSAIFSFFYTYVGKAVFGCFLLYFSVLSSFYKGSGAQTQNCFNTVVAALVFLGGSMSVGLFCGFLNLALSFYLLVGNLCASFALGAFSLCFLDFVCPAYDGSTARLPGECPKMKIKGGGGCGCLFLFFALLFFSSFFPQ